MNIKPTPSPHGSIAPPPPHLLAGWWRSYGRRWNLLAPCYLSTQDRKACLETPLRWLMPPSNHRMYQPMVMRDLAPSNALRRWFGHDPGKWNEFRRRYADELDHNPAAVAALIARLEDGPVPHGRKSVR